MYNTVRLAVKAGVGYCNEFGSAGFYFFPSGEIYYIASFGRIFNLFYILGIVKAFFRSGKKLPDVGKISYKNNLGHVIQGYRFKGIVPLCD